MWASANVDTSIDFDTLLFGLEDHFNESFGEEFSPNLKFGLLSQLVIGGTLPRGCQDKHLQ